MMRRLVFLAGALVSIGAEAQENRPPQIWIDPSLRIERPIELADVAIDVRIQGFVATTRMDLRFHNPNSRVLEGELVFPLGVGQTLTGYALEVNGALREGVIVAKETARVAYESTVRQNIDPGLAELTRGNVFRTRLYPIPANGDKRVVVQFDQTLADVGSAWRYVLPLQFSQPIGRFRVRAEALRSEQPVPAGPAGTLRFDKVGEGFLGELERTDFRPERELRFDVPKPATPVTAFAVPDRLEPAWRTFAASVQAAPSGQSAPKAPRNVTIFFDASGSAAARDRAREVAFLKALFARLHSRLAGDVAVELVPFRDARDTPQRFTVRGGDATALLRAIDALAIDGGSSYGAVRLDASAKPDLVIVIGDGLSNFGAHEPSLVRADGVRPRVLLLHAAQSVDSRALSRIARDAGGQLVDLLQTDADAALRQLDVPRWLLLGSRVVAGVCTDLAPAAPQPVAASFAVYGRCRGPAVVELSIGSGDGAPLVRRVALADAALLDPERGRFVERLWATARIADVDTGAASDDAAITALATRYGVVTRTTSLLVLDRVEDYVRYRIEPREPELLAQYRTLVAQSAKTIAADEQRMRQAHFDRILAQWREFKAYHETRHPWLETVIEPMAQLEAARWNSLAQRPEAAKPAREAQALAKQAQVLAGRWLKDGADDATRTAWEAEAATLALRLDALRKQRLALAPDSDAMTKDALESVVVTGSRDGDDRRRSEQVMEDEAMPLAEAAPPPAPALSAPASRAQEVAADGPAGGVLAKKIGTGAAERKAEELPQARIELAAWNPDTPYLAKIKGAPDPYAAYLAERATQGTTPAFFLDCADWFRREAKNDALGLRILSNLAEIDVDNVPLMRVLAYRLQQWERFDLAVPQFEEALKLRGEEPQSRRDLALALSRMPQADVSRAVELLWDVVAREWDGRFPDVQLIALHELNDVIARAPQGARQALQATIAKLAIDAAFLDPVPVGLRVVLTWDADNTDVDLWVVDPAGDTAIYSQPRTKTGGHMSRDFTGGYGPEVFTIRRPLPGTYVVKAHFYGDRRQTLTGAATVQAEFLTHFGTGKSGRAATTRRLEGDDDTIEIGNFTVQ